MKRYATAVFISIAIAGLLTGCGRSADIGKDKALEIALKDAKLTEADVTRLRVSKDRDDGESIYDVEFTGGDTEYDYEILASNGDILSADYEESHGTGLGVQNGQQKQEKTQETEDPGQTGNQEQGGNAQTVPADVSITLEQASKLALDRVPGASEQDLKIELDYDDGRQKYEGDIIYDQREYEFEIDANTGDFLEWKEERR